MDRKFVNSNTTRFCPIEDPFSRKKTRPRRLMPSVKQPKTVENNENESQIVSKEMYNLQCEVSKRSNGLEDASYKVKDCTRNFEEEKEHATELWGRSNNISSCSNIVSKTESSPPSIFRGLVESSVISPNCRPVPGCVGSQRASIDKVSTASEEKKKVRIKLSFENIERMSTSGANYMTKYK